VTGGDTAEGMDRAVLPRILDSDASGFPYHSRWGAAVPHAVGSAATTARIAVSEMCRGSYTMRAFPVSALAVALRMPGRLRTCARRGGMVGLIAQSRHREADAAG